ncbi:MAG: flavodoxin family protein [Candidatus Sifarchaeia archaeon]
MKVLVINGSPRKERGVTSGLLTHFVKGMEEANADVDILYSKGLDIGDCRGCFNCWGTTPGKCIQDDEMTNVLEKIADADILVLATPVYIDGMTGSLKTLLDRTIPLLHGAFELRDDHCRHALRDHVKTGLLVLFSVCGFTEMDNFDPLITHVKAISKNMNRQFVGSVLRPYGWIIEPGIKQGAKLGFIHEAVREAGFQLVSDGKMRNETLTTIAQDILPRDEVISLMQQNYGDK